MLLAAGLLSAAPRADAAVLAELRVEGPNGNLDPGTWYVTGTEMIRRSKPQRPVRADGDGKARTCPGPTALGLPQTRPRCQRGDRARSGCARTRPGPFVCEIVSVLGPANFDLPGRLRWLELYDGLRLGCLGPT